MNYVYIKKGNRNYKYRTWDIKDDKEGLICIHCNTWKPPSAYSKNKKAFLGIRSTCRDCAKIEKETFYKSKKGVIQTIWDSQKRSAKEREMNPPSYTKEWFFEWVESQDVFHEIYDKWIQSGYDRWQKPSVDRLDPFESYTPTNIEVTTWQENVDRNLKAVKKGEARVEYAPVIQLDMEGNFIKEFINVRIAERELNIAYQNIWKVCNNRRNHAGNYKWMYLKDYMEKNPEFISELKCIKKL